MDSSLLKTVGQIAGIGGLALGVFLVIFREVIRKNIFPHLAQIHGYRIIRMIVVATFLIASMGIAAWTYVQAIVVTSDPKEPVFTDRETDIARRFWDSALTGDWKTAYDLFPPVLHQQMAFPNFVKASSYALSQFAAPPITRTFEGAQSASGTLVVSSLARFDHTSTFRELLTFQLQKGKWVPWSFVINPVEWPQANEYVFVTMQPSELIGDWERSPVNQRHQHVADRYVGRYVPPPGWALIIEKAGPQLAERTCDVEGRSPQHQAKVTLLKVLDGCSLASGASIQVVGRIDSVSNVVRMNAVRLWR
jgi:hypothetical protein